MQCISTCQHLEFIITLTSVLLLCHPNVSLGPFNINEKSLEREEWRRAALRRSRELLWAWNRETTISFVTFITARSLTHHSESCTLPKMTASPNYPGVRQPCSLCCFFNKRSLLRQTEKQDCNSSQSSFGTKQVPISIYNIWTVLVSSPGGCVWLWGMKNVVITLSSRWCSI